MSVNATCGVVMMMVMMVMTMTIQISEEVQASLGLWGKWLGWHQRGAGLWPDLVSDPLLHSGQPPGSIALTPLRPSAQLHRVPGPAHISLDTKAWGPSSAQFCLPGEGCAPAVRAQQDGVPSGPSSTPRPGWRSCDTMHDAVIASKGLPAAPRPWGICRPCPG